MTDFSIYTDAILSATIKTTKERELISKKQEILNGIYEFHNVVPSTTLFIGFNPAILSKSNGKVTVTNISKEAMDYLSVRGVSFAYVEPIDLIDMRFDVVIAMDEYFTFAKNSVEQQTNVKLICNLANEFVVTTLRDYKNQDFKDREFSIPTAVRSSDKSLSLYTEFHDWDYEDRNKWASTLHEIVGNELSTYGPFARHTMYFKQLANFSAAAGAADFSVHKNLMYKSAVRKNYEHVISIRFDR